MDFEENYERTASHFACLRSAVRNHTRIKTLLFNKIRHISPSAALVLASEVDRWNHRTKNRLRAEVETWHDDIKRLLCQMGYFELLHLTTPAVISTSKSTTFLQFKRGDVNNRNAGQIAKQLRIEIEAIVGFTIKKHFLFEGLSEAITNVGQHAYPDSDNYPFKQWWLSASYDQNDQTLCVIFYDQGVGIPETLPHAGYMEWAKEIIGSWNDSQKIEAAMKPGRSAIDEIERGKGLQNFIEFAKSHREGFLSIYSLRGLYRMTWEQNLDGSAPKAHRCEHANSVGGTLIEWKVKF